MTNLTDEKLQAIDSSLAYLVKAAQILLAPREGTSILHHWQATLDNLVDNQTKLQLSLEALHKVILEPTIRTAISKLVEQS